MDGSKTGSDVGPLPTGATVNGATLTVTYNKRLQTSVADSKFAFRVKGAGGVDSGNRNASQSPSSVSADSTTLTLTLGIAARAGEVVTLTYEGTVVKATAADGGRAAPMFRDLAVTNETAGAAGPEPVRASVLVRTLRVAFDEALDDGSAPAGSAFLVRVADPDGDGLAIPGTGTAAVSGEVVTVELAEAVRENVLANVSYTKPDANPLQGAGAGKPAVLSFDRVRIETVDEGVPPKVVAGAVSQTQSSPARSKAVLSFSETLDESSVPAGSDFAVTVGTATVTVSDSDVAVEGNNVILTLGVAAAAGTAVVVAYSPGTNPIRDPAGNPAAAFTENLTAKGAGKPALQSAAVDGARVKLTYDKPLDPESVPDAGAFTLHYTLGLSETAADRTEYFIDVAAVEVEGETAVLRLDHPVFPCAGATPFTVTYAKPGTSPLQGLDETDAGGLTNQDVTNARATWCGGNWLGDARVGSVILRARRPFATDTAPRSEWFTVTASGGPVTVTGAAFSADDPHELKLTLSRDIAPDERVTVSYRRPEGESGLWDVDGNQLADITDAPVANDAPGAPALTASFRDVPAAHGGRGSEFSFELRFSENFPGRLDYMMLRDEALQATNARVTGAKRVARGQNRRWTITVRPRSSEDVTVALAATTDCSAAGAICTPDGRPLSNSPSATVSQRSNQPATGTPAIAGEARVGETLTASTADIEDADGLSGAAFAFQWLSDGDEIAGATEASYTLTDSEAGAAIRVRAAFTDDAGNEETLTSAATAAVAPALSPLTAEFLDLPAEHGGRGREFSFELRFSEDFPGRLPYRILKDEALQATNARVTGAQRVARGQNRRWTITVRPRSSEDVTVSLPATTDCGAPRAVCTESGRPLTSSSSATVTGPVGIAVADARVEEGAGAVLAFAVTLSRAATSAFTVDYATSDGSARAGEDYTAASGTLSLQAGESSATIEVGVLDDAHDEGEETLTLTLSNVSGGHVTDGEATGTIENTDLMPAALLARFGRATAEQVVTHIEERMAAPRRRGFRARFAGREFQPGSEQDFALGFLSSFAQPMGMGPAGAAPLHGAAMGTAPMGGVAMGGGTLMGMGSHTAGAAGYGPLGAHEPGLFGTMVGHDPLSNSEFELNREARGGTLSLWSRSSRSHFSGMDDALSLNGDVRTSMFGADYSRGALTLGLSVGRTLGLGGYSGPSSGQMTTSMTGFYPWVGYQVNDRVSVWGVTGYGAGALSLTPGSAAALETGVSMAMSAVGTRGELIGSRATGGFALAFKADALWVGVGSELLDGAAGRLNASEAGVTRVRTALEGSRGFTLGGGRLSLTPSVEVGLRRDGGDAETGAGMDVGGGLAFTDTVTGLSLDVRVRTLVVHQGRRVPRPRVVAVARVGPDAVEPAGADGEGGSVVGWAGARRRRGAVGRPDGLRHGLAPDARVRRAGRRRGGLRAAGGRALRGDAARRVDDVTARPGLPVRLRPRGAGAGESELRAGGRRAAAGEPDARRVQQRFPRPGLARLVDVAAVGLTAGGRGRHEDHGASGT